MSKPKLIINTGLRIGRLCVGDLVRFVQTHPLFLETPTSYLQQGRLRECACDCGQVRLFAESILATGRIQSCGCLRQEIRAAAAEGKLKRLQVKGAQTSNTVQIQIEQQRLKGLKMIQVPFRDEFAIEECSKRLRQLYAQRASLTKRLKLVTTPSTE